MFAVGTLLAGVAGLVLGVVLGAAAVVSAHRRHDRPGPPPPDPPAPPAPPDTRLDRFAADLLEAADDAPSPELRRRLTALVLRLDVELIQPDEQEPFDEDLYVVERLIRTASPARHGTVARVVRPGLRKLSGEVLRKATVNRYHCAELPRPDRPDGVPGEPPDQRPDRLTAAARPGESGD